jgi:hypothetical protein
MTRVTYFWSMVLAAALLALGFSGANHPAAADGNSRCTPVGGTFMTNLGAIGGTSVPSTTLGRVTGDLSGAVAATILSVQQIGDNFVFTVQHHVVTDEGDFVNAKQAMATTVQVQGAEKPTFAIVSYPVSIIPGGTGKFANATGEITNIGEVQVPGFATGDLSGATLILRYSGNICFPTL